MRGTHPCAMMQTPMIFRIGSSRSVKRWLAHPLKVGFVILLGPAAGAAGREAHQVTPLPDQAVIEVGAGTGPVTKALLELFRRSGFSWSRSTAIAAGFQRQLPQAQAWPRATAPVAREIIPAQWHGKISTIVSGILMLLLPFEVGRRRCSTASSTRWRRAAAVLGDRGPGRVAAAARPASAQGPPRGACSPQRPAQVRAGSFSARPDRGLTRP